MWWSDGEYSLLGAAHAYAHIHAADIEQGKMTADGAAEALVSRIRNFEPDHSWDYERVREFTAARDVLAHDVERSHRSGKSLGQIERTLFDRLRKARRDAFTES